MKSQTGQAVTEWVLVMAVLAIAMAFVFLTPIFSDGTFSQVIGGWYQGASERVARAGIKTTV